MVNAEWLKNRLQDSNTKILDASWYLPAMGRDPLAEYRESHIPGAKFFDINTIARPDTDLPHMLPTETQFAAAADALEITPENHVVLYDGMGLFSAARAWFMFKLFGHQSASVLDGGFHSWKAAGFETENAPDLSDDEVLVATIACRNAAEGKTKYPARLDLSKVVTLETVMKKMETKDEQIVDARSSGRFRGTQPEVRPGLRSGHIPGSINVPFTDLLTPEGKLKSEDELDQIFTEAGFAKDKDVVCSCGSGVTACVVALALDHMGFDKKVSLYDGSWSEWGAREDTPIEAEGN